MKVYFESFGSKLKEFSLQSMAEYCHKFSIPMRMLSQEQKELAEVLAMVEGVDLPEIIVVEYSREAWSVQIK